MAGQLWGPLFEFTLSFTVIIKMIFPAPFLTLLYAAQIVSAINFPYEKTQLTESDVGNNTDIAFGKLPVSKRPQCKSFPGYDGWPSSDRWSGFNVSLGGALIRGIPPAAACYDGEYKNATACANVRRRQGDALFA